MNCDVLCGERSDSLFPVAVCSLQTQSNGTFNGKLFLITRRVCATTSFVTQFFASTDMLQGSPKISCRKRAYSFFVESSELRQRYLTSCEGLNSEDPSRAGHNGGATW